MIIVSQGLKQLIYQHQKNSVTSNKLGFVWSMSGKSQYDARVFKLQPMFQYLHSLDHIPFVLAGVVLVVLLLKCNLTVSGGHINAYGIIFYANNVRVNKALLFPNQGMAFQIFSTFVA